MEIIRNVVSSNNMYALMELLRETDPLKVVAAFDTEADGLDIIESRPFLYQFGFYNFSNDTLYAFAVDLEHEPAARFIIGYWHTWVKDVPIYVGHNVKFDLHMLANIGMEYFHTNLSDTMFYIRFAHDNVAPRNGGVKLGLKDYCTKYVDPTAKHHDHQLQVERAAIAKQYNIKLKAALGWSMKKMDDFFGDSTNTEADFPDAQSWFAYKLWHQQLPPALQRTWGKLETEDIPYNILNRATVVRYGLEDIVLTLKVLLQTMPVVEARGTTNGLLIENQCIRPLWKQERIGFDIDTDYVENSFVRMRRYIRTRRADLVRMAGFPMTANQNAVLLKMLNDAGIDVESTGEDILARLPRQYPDHPLIEVVNCIRELRTLEKWFTTYLMRFKGKTKIYTSINQVGAATLRMSSDFQQFPKKGLKDKDGNELFNPRRCIKVTAGYDATVYLDYSQIELRVQALYTILVGHPDVNLCRAYMPYNCTSPTLGHYDFYNTEIRKAWNNGDWYLDEDPTQLWVPTDVHGATTMAAFNIDESHPDYHDLRYLGKRVNFAKNYGAQYGRIETMFPEYDEATIHAIDNGYYKAFPGVKYYQNYCYELGQYQPYATNLFGIRYWGVSGHNLINMFIQGSCATFLKLKIIELDLFLESITSDIKAILPIHDEQQFAFRTKDLTYAKDLQAIMESWDDCLIPIVADAEITTTYWSEKKEMAHG